MVLITLLLISIFTPLLIKDVHSAKILHFHHIGGKSNVMFNHKISKILLSNHHEIFAISPIPMNENLANYTDLGVHQDFFQYSDKFTLGDKIRGIYVNRKLSYEIRHSNCEKLYQNSRVIETLKNITIDLVLLEIDSAECFLPFAAQFQVPIIGITTPYFLFPDFDGLMGNPVNPSYVPIPFGELTTEMSFFQRVRNTKDYLLQLSITWYYINQAESMVAKYMASPPITDLYDRIALVFCNGHFSFVSKPTAPSTVDIAGIHIRKPLPLPEDIQTFVNNSTEGVILLSLGSVAKFSGLPKRMHDSFINVLRKLPYRVIWRHDKPEMISDKFENILVRKWLPQQDILAHPKVVLFITHSGIYSTYESIHYGVPMLTFPILYDQQTNAAIVQSLGIGMPLNLRHFSEQSLKSNIEEVVQNKKYRENIVNLSKVFKDRPLSPQDTLIYWVNYVLRHKHVPFLKPAGAKLPFYQYLLLDVLLYFAFTLVLSSYLIYKIIKAGISVLKRFSSEKIICKIKTS